MGLAWGVSPDVAVRLWLHAEKWWLEQLGHLSLSLHIVLGSLCLSMWSSLGFLIAWQPQGPQISYQEAQISRNKS